MPKVSNPAPKECAECGADITGRRGKTCPGECREARRRKQAREWSQRNWPQRQAGLEWRKRLPQMRCLTCGGEIPKRPGVRTPTRCPEHQPEHTREMRDAKEERRRLRRYGLTPERYAGLILAQGDACAICRGTDPRGRGRWHIDHDHACCPGQGSCGECVRALLCAHCNVMIGLADERPEVLDAASRYLRHHLK